MDNRERDGIAGLAAGRLGAVTPVGLSFDLSAGHRLSLSSERKAVALHVENGWLTVETTRINGKPSTLLILIPGDLLWIASLPEELRITLRAATEVTLQRLTCVDHAKHNGADPGGSDGQAAGDAECDCATTMLAPSVAKFMRHAVRVGRLSAEQRLAGLFVDLAGALGRSTPGGIVFDMPLARQDVADYLLLNPDTLSRQMSRFKSEGLISQPARDRLVVRDIAKLKAMVAQPS
ncbi:MAG: Crp/Fnr family transcriptional regulator [Hyphomicrobiaceae bacterium]